jgi:type III secretion protein L
MPDGTPGLTPLTSLPRSPGGRIVRREDAENWTDGYRFVAEARREADVLSRNAHAAYEDAKARGFAEGRNAGSAEAAAIVADTLAKVDRYLASIETQVAELSQSIVEQVLGRFDDAEIVARAAKQALASFRREKYLTVRVPPQHLDEVQRTLSTWSKADLSGPTLVVEADPRLAPRQCTIVTEFAVVDASLDVQLGIVAGALAAGEGPVRAS